MHVVAGDNFVAERTSEGPMDDELFSSLTANVAAAFDRSADESPDGAATPEPSNAPGVMATETDEVDEEMAAEDAVDAEEAETGPNWESEDNPFYVKARQEEAKRLELERRDQQTRALFDQLMAQAQERKDTEFEATLAETDPELAAVFRERKLAQTQAVVQTRQEAESFAKGLTALHLALTQTLPPEQIAAVMREAEELARLDGAEAMQRHVQTKREAKQTQSAELRQTQARLQEALNRLAALERKSSGVDAVDAGVARPPAQGRPEDAETLDDFFARAPQIGRVFGWAPSA